MRTIERYSHIRKIHIIQNDQILYQMTRDTDQHIHLFPVGCIFKSFISTLIGIAIKEGKIHSVDDHVIDYIPYDEIVSTEWYELKIKHVLSKTTGIKWPDPEEPLPQGVNDIMQLCFENKPGNEFKYKPDPQIIILLLESIYNMKIQNILESKLLSHFHNSEYEWNGIDDNMKVSIDVLDELGKIMLSKGMVDKKHLFSEDYYNKCIQEYSKGGFPESNPYGLGWWISEYKDITYLYAAGFGGQILAIIPSKNIIVSILSDMDRPHPENQEIIRSIIEEYGSF